MKKSNFLEIIDNKFILTAPLFYNKGDFCVKKEMKLALLEISNTVGKCILGFSTGADSIFLYCCFRELVEEGKLQQSAFDIIFFDVDFSEFNITNTHPLDPVVKWRLNYWKDVYKVMTFKPTYKDILQYYNKYNSIYDFKHWGEIMAFFLAYCRTKCEFPVIAVNGCTSGMVVKPQTRTLYSVYSGGNVVDPFYYSRDLYCAMFVIKHPFIDIIDKTYPLWVKCIQYYIKRQNYFDVYPETVYGYPKFPEWFFEKDNLTSKAQSFFSKLFDEMPTYRDSNGGQAPFWKSFYLPNGEVVTSVGQTQEFFNRHS